MSFFSGMGQNSRRPSRLFIQISLTFTHPKADMMPNKWEEDAVYSRLDFLASLPLSSLTATVPGSVVRLLSPLSSLGVFCDEPEDTSAPNPSPHPPPSSDSPRPVDHWQSQGGRNQRLVLHSLSLSIYLFPSLSLSLSLTLYLFSSLSNSLSLTPSL